MGRARVCAQICAHQKLRTKTEKAAPLQASRRRPSHPGSENCRSPRIRQHLVRVRGEKGQEKQSEVTAAERGPHPGLPVSAGALPWPLGSGGAGQGTGLADRDRTRPPLCRGALSKSRPRSGLLSSSLLMGLGQSPPGPGQVDALRGPEPAFKRWPLNAGVFRCRGGGGRPLGSPASSPAVHGSSALAPTPRLLSRTKACPEQDPPPWPDAPRLLGEPHVVGLPHPRRLVDVFPPHSAPTGPGGDLHGAWHAAGSWGGPHVALFFSVFTVSTGRGWGPSASPRGGCGKGRGCHR